MMGEYEDNKQARYGVGATQELVRKEVKSEELLKDVREVAIRHEGQLYILRKTSKGKLILTK